MEVEDSPNHQIHIEQELLDLIAYCGVSQGCVDALIEHEYTSVAVFRFAFVDTNALETFITHLGTIQEAPPNWSTSREAASIRHLYHQCVLAMNKTPTEKSSSSQNKQAGSMENLLDLAWAELPPARVKEADLLRMKKEFHEKYPSESLSSSNTPCARLVATVVQQQSRGAFVWIPWKELLSESRWLDIQEKGRKRQKLEGIILYDAVGDIDDDELSGAPYFLLNILETRAIAMALTKVCHLSMGKRYISAFMKLYTAKTSDSGLRPPSMKESQSADKEFWSQVFTLTNEDPKTWSMETAIQEVLQVKNVLDIQMMQRPRTQLKGKGQHKGKTFTKTGKGKEKGKGKSTWDKNNYGKNKQWQPHWAKFIKGSQGEEQQFCHRFHLYDSCNSTSCRFSHLCPVMQNGKPCGQKHRAVDHAKQSPKN